MKKKHSFCLLAISSTLFFFVGVLQDKSKVQSTKQLISNNNFLIFQSLIVR